MTNLQKRIASAAVAIPLLVVFIFFLPPWSLMIPASVAIFVGSVEVAMMLAGRKTMVHILLGSGFVTAFCIYILWVKVFSGSEELVTVGFCSTAVVLLLSCVAFFEPVETLGRRVSSMFIGLFYPGVLLTLIVVSHCVVEDGRWWTFCILLTAFLSDTGAYFAGRVFGKRPLAPHISPKKTVEGSMGGLAGSLVATLSAHFVYLKAISLSAAFVLGIGGSICGQLGDLVESALKRSGGRKDAGRFFPGHGGMMDRIDGLLFVSLLFYIYIHFIKTS